MLRPDDLARSVQWERWTPGPGVDAWVENHWGVRWALPAGETFTSSVLPHPTVHLTVERPARPQLGTRVLTGVPTSRYDTDLTGEGWVVGAKFRPGAFTALTGVPARALRDTAVDADSLLPTEMTVRLTAVTPESWDEAAVSSLENALSVLTGKDPDDEYFFLLDVFGSMVADPGLLTVEQVASLNGVGMRHLQRLFAHYVGVTPKWVLSRFRMHDVVSALDEGSPAGLAELAAEFGWYDQAHFTRDFTRLVGVTPREYRRPAHH